MIPLMYSSWLLLSNCLTNLLNSVNVSQSSGVPDYLAYQSLDVFLISLLMFLFTHGASHLPLSVLCGICFSVDVRNNFDKLVVHFIS